MKKILHKTLTYYLIFGTLMVLMTIPLYYFFYDRYYTNEIDEYLLGQKDKVYLKSLNTLRLDEIHVWNQYNDDEEILPDNGQKEENRFITENRYDNHEKESAPYRVMYSRIKIESESQILKIPISIFEAKKIMWSVTMLQSVFFFALLFCFFLITHFIYAKLWKPFYHTLSDIERFNIGSNEMPTLTETDTQEFHQLNNAVGILMHNNMKAYKAQKEFTENASHEMQTPLAIMQSKLDILLQQPELTKEQFQIMQSLYENISRLTRMNKNLLLLAKIDNLQFLDIQDLNVAEILDNSLSFLIEQTETNHITTTINIKNNKLTVRANKTLMESLINNLLTNAVRHNIPNGYISVSLEATRLAVTNTGSIKELNKNILFRRFGRMNEKASSNGLGLSIVRQICLLYDWEIDYTFENGMHRFEVIF